MSYWTDLLDHMRTRHLALGKLVTALEEAMRLEALLDDITPTNETRIPRRSVARSGKVRKPRAKPKLKKPRAARQLPGSRRPTPAPRAELRVQSPTPADPPPVATAPASTNVVEARNAAVIRVLRGSRTPLEFEAIFAAMPPEPALSEEQRKVACRNTLTRLRAREDIIAADGGGWLYRR